MKKVLVEQYTEKNYNMNQLIQMCREKMINARKNGLCVEFITTKPVYNEQNEVINVTTNFPAELNVYRYIVNNEASDFAIRFPWEV